MIEGEGKVGRGGEMIEGFGAGSHRFYGGVPLTTNKRGATRRAPIITVNYVLSIIVDLTI